MQHHHTRPLPEQPIHMTMQLRAPHAIQNTIRLAQITQPPDLPHVNQPHTTSHRRRIQINRARHNHIHIHPPPQLRRKPHVVITHPRPLRRPRRHKRDPRTSRPTPHQSRRHPLIRLDRPLRNTLPRVLSHPPPRTSPQPLQRLLRTQNPRHTRRDRIRIMRLKRPLQITQHLRPRRRRARRHRRTTRHRLQHRQPKPLIKRRKHKQRTSPIQSTQLSIRQAVGDHELIRADPRRIRQARINSGCPDFR